jgi:hypothetical protein
MAFRRAQKQKPWRYNQGFLFGGADESRTRDLLNAMHLHGSTACLHHHRKCVPDAVSTVSYFGVSRCLTPDFTRQDVNRVYKLKEAYGPVTW